MELCMTYVRVHAVVYLCWKGTGALQFKGLSYRGCHESSSSQHFNETVAFTASSSSYGRRGMHTSYPMSPFPSRTASGCRTLFPPLPAGPGVLSNFVLREHVIPPPQLVPWHSPYLILLCMRQPSVSFAHPNRLTLPNDMRVPG